MKYKQVAISRFFFLYSLFFCFHLNAQTINQAPMANITTAATTVIAGSTVQLDGTASSDPENNDLIYSWKLLIKPPLSAATLSTPSPSMPSFFAEREGTYVVELQVSDGDQISEPEYLVLSVARPRGTELLSTPISFTPPSLCALSGGVLGCFGFFHPFTATPGDYLLSVEGVNLKSLSLSLNYVRLPTPLFSEGISRFFVPVSLSADNNIVVNLRGEVGSFVRINFISNPTVSGANSPPTVADLSLEVSTMMRSVSGQIAVSDPDSGQSHSFTILNDARYGEAFLMGNLFQYQGDQGFKGIENFYVLTYDNGMPVRGTVSKVSVNVAYNTGPTLPPTQEHQVFREGQTITFRLKSALDLEGDDLSYSLVSMPSQGNLSCIDRENKFYCTYIFPNDFNGNVMFSYKANDGQLDSNVSMVTLKAPTFSSPIAQIATGRDHSCLITVDGNVRCWGYNFSSQLGYRGLLNNLGDDESPLSRGYVDIHQRIVKLSLGGYFTCALTDAGKVRCWNSLGSSGELGFLPRGYSSIYFTPEEGIDFGTNLRVIDIASQIFSSCALFENGRVKCWGLGGSGILGYGKDYTNVGGTGASLKDLPYLELGGKVTSLAGSGKGEVFCAILEGGGVRCWGNKGLILGFVPGLDDQNIGDDEHPDAFATLPLGGPVQQVAIGANHACGLLSSGEIQCWGHNGFGQFGLGHGQNVVYDENFDPVDITVPLDRKAKKVVAGRYFTCALLDDGTVRCWGVSNFGQLGLGYAGNLSHLGDNELITTAPALNFSDEVIDIVAGLDHICALLISGSLKCWGKNSRGQLGLGHTNNVGDDETVGDFQDSDVGGFSRIYPRIGLAPQFPLNSQTVEFSSENSISRAKVKSYVWDFGDGTTTQGSDSTHVFSSLGVYNVVLTITDVLDNDISTDQLVWVRSSLGHPPDMPRRQFFTVEQNKVSTLNLLPAWDNEGDTITYFLEDMPAPQGILENCLGGTESLTCRYTPPQDFTGTIKFAYRANDGNRDSLENTEVEINVVSDADTIEKSIESKGIPFVSRFEHTGTDFLEQTDTWADTRMIVRSDQTPPFFLNTSKSVEAKQDMAQTITLEAATDEEGDSLTYTLVSAPSSGTLSGCLEGGTDLTCDYIPDGNTTEEISFTYKANDGQNDSLEVFTVFIDVEAP